jgi:hypothetical protein
MIRHVVFASFVIGVLAHPASAQSTSKPVYPTPQAPPIPAAADVPPPPPRPFEATKTENPGKTDEAKQAVAQAKPLPRRTSVGGASDSIGRRDSQATQGRFSNPGGVGLYAEYYTPNTPTSQLDMHPTHQTRFDKGAGPDRAEQIAAFQAGQMRTRNIQNNINAYGRPYAAYGAGFGFGFGLATGGFAGGGMR